MTDARRRKIDVVVVWALDRFGRSLRHLVTTIDELTALGVGFVAFTQGIDTSSTSPAATLQLQVLAAVAQFERSMIQARVRSGIAKAKAQGKTLGRPRKDVRPERVHHLRRQGMSLRAIGRHIGINKGVVSRILAESPCPEIPLP